MTDLPVITVAMPIYNRKYCIEKVLDSISNQSYPKNRIKLIFVDNYSTDGTFEALQRFSRYKGNEYLTISILRLKSNIPQARNVCVKNMLGNYIFFWDSDVLAPDNEALERIVKLMLIDDKTMAVGFPYYLEGKPRLDEKIFRVRSEEGVGRVTGLGLGFTLIHKDVFNKIGLFNEKMNYSEDTEFFLRIKRAGLNVFIDTRTPCKHLKPETFKHSRGYIATGRGFLNYLKYVKYCYGTMPYIYDQFLATRSPTHYLRLIIYLFLPVVILASIFASWIIALFYFLPLLMYHIYKARRNRLFGFITFVYYLLPGVAISYGYLFHTLMKIMSRARKNSPLGRNG